MALQWEHEWQRFYVEALLETNPLALVGRVVAAEKAILFRVEELCTSSEGKVEWHAIEDAITGISRLKKEMLKSPIEIERVPTAVARSAAYVSVNSTMSSASKPIFRINADFLDLDPDPIPAEAVLDGSPQARVNRLITSRDWTSTVVVWDCTPGSFKWQYTKDETAVFLCGEAFMIDEKNEEHRFGAGDLAFFPAGTTCTWRVTEHIRKVAVVRETIWRPLGFILKVSKKLLRGEQWQLKMNRPTNNLDTDW